VAAPSPAVSNEPRWPATIAVLSVGVLQLALPRSLTVGPAGSLLVIVTALVIPIILAHRLGRYRLNHWLAMVLATIITAELIAGVILLIVTLPRHVESPIMLLRATAVLWVTNVIVFAYWYWRLDLGGPHFRPARSHEGAAFNFPQFQRGETTWRPGFIDYLFLAFTTSTALSPTDTPVLSRWAKLGMMLQATIAFTCVTILVARAVNIL
jgi:uncharacterized membrane protein